MQSDQEPERDVDEIVTDQLLQSAVIEGDDVVFRRDDDVDFKISLREVFELATSFHPREEWEDEKSGNEGEGSEFWTPKKAPAKDECSDSSEEGSTSVGVCPWMFLVLYENLTKGSQNVVSRLVAYQYDVLPLADGVFAEVTVYVPSDTTRKGLLNIICAGWGSSPKNKKMIELAMATNRRLLLETSLSRAKDYSRSPFAYFLE